MKGGRAHLCDHRAGRSKVHRVMRWRLLEILAEGQGTSENHRHRLQTNVFFVVVVVVVAAAADAAIVTRCVPWASAAA